MISVDFRTRSDADIVAVDARSFFDEELPARIERHADLAVPGAMELAPRSLAFSVDDRCWTLALDGDRITVTPGDADARAMVALDAAGLTDLVHDVRTPMGFLAGGDLDMRRGRLEHFLDWWVILRSLVDGRPVQTAGAVTFGDLDLGRTFRPDDSDEEMAHFLGEAGFLHIGGLFTQDEMAQVSADIDAAAPRYEPDDGRSWWARTASGEHRLVRMQRFQEQSPTTGAILDDDRFLRIGRLTSDGHRLDGDRRDGNAIEALVKPLGIVEGLSDLPWHKDCSLGRHSYRCCSLTVGISVTGADATSGQLRVVAGSHRALIQPALVRPGLDLPEVDLATTTGDVTVHLSCTLHMSQAPTERERRVMYTGFRLPVAGEGTAAAAANERRLDGIREAAHKNVNQIPAVSGPSGPAAGMGGHQRAR